LKKGGIVLLQAGKGKAVRERPITDSDGGSRDVSVDQE